jgi:hypothetical protein
MAAAEARTDTVAARRVVVAKTEGLEVRPAMLLRFKVERIAVSKEEGVGWKGLETGMKKKRI